MRLPPEDVKLFYTLYSALLIFVNERHQIEDVSTPEELMSLGIEKRYSIRESLYEDDELIDEFVKLNPRLFSEQELEIVSGWKDYVKGSFYFLKQLKEYAIFLDAGSDSEVYGVLALENLFGEFFTHLPTLVRTVLLPFNGRIIYDGVITSQNIYFGGNIRRRFDDEYNQSKARYGIITTLPYEEKESETSDGDLLRYYLRSARNREVYRKEIASLTAKSKDNRALYHQEMGKYYAKHYGRSLREAGIESGWFGILEGNIVGSGRNKKTAIANIESIVPSERMDYVYLFQLKAGK